MLSADKDNSSPVRRVSYLYLGVLKSSLIHDRVCNVPKSSNSKFFILIGSLSTTGLSAHLLSNLLTSHKANYTTMSAHISAEDDEKMSAKVQSPSATESGLNDEANEQAMALASRSLAAGEP